MPTAKKANTVVNSCAANIAVVLWKGQYVDVEGERQGIFICSDPFMYNSRRAPCDLCLLNSGSE